MERRDYVKTVASLPLMSVPVSASTEPTGEEFWEMSSSWSPRETNGEVVLVRNKEVEHRWEYEEYPEWQKATLLNAQQVAEDTEYVADLFGLDIQDLYIDPPHFSAHFKDENNIVHLHHGKYSDEEYVYHVETHTDEALHGVEGGANSIEELVKEVSKKVN